jgi:tetratricopeptide (TPR) repeat protein
MDIHAMNPLRPVLRICCGLLRRNIRPALRWGGAALVCIGMLGAASQSHAQAQGTFGERRIVVGDTDIWKLAESLFAEREYYRAVTEYKRLLSYFPDSAHAKAAQNRIAQALLLGGEPRQALEYIRPRAAGSSGVERDQWLVLSALGWLEADGTEPLPLRKPNIDAALKALREVSSEYPEKQNIAGFVQALDAPPDLPHKSPGLAGTLSALVPGAGSLYVGRTSEAALAFVVNALLISGTVTAFQEHQDGLGVGLGVFALAFYGGNIYAAVSGAHKYNDQA